MAFNAEAPLRAEDAIFYINSLTENRLRVLYYSG
jgi:hypothetical protein